MLPQGARPAQAARVSSATTSSKKASQVSDIPMLPARRPGGSGSTASVRGGRTQSPGGRASARQCRCSGSGLGHPLADPMDPSCGVPRGRPRPRGHRSPRPRRPWPAYRRHGVSMRRPMPLHPRGRERCREGDHRHRVHGHRGVHEHVAPRSERHRSSSPSVGPPSCATSWSTSAETSAESERVRPATCTRYWSRLAVPVGARHPGPPGPRSGADGRTATGSGPGWQRSRLPVPGPCPGRARW